MRDAGLRDAGLKAQSRVCCVGSKLKGLVGSMLRVLGTLGLKGSECLGLRFRIQAFGTELWS